MKEFILVKISGLNMNNVTLIISVYEGPEMSFQTSNVNKCHIP